MPLRPNVLLDTRDNAILPGNREAAERAEMVERGAIGLARGEGGPGPRAGHPKGTGAAKQPRVEHLTWRLLRSSVVERMGPASCLP
jgi:hypothetical protein